MEKHFSLKYLIAICTGIILVFSIFFQYRYVPLFPNQVKIGATYMTMNNTFYKIVNSEIEKVVDSKEDVLYTRDPALSVSKQCQQIQSFIDNKVDVIIINPIDSNSKELLKVLEKAKKIGIKIIVVDSQLQNKKVADVTIVSDNYNAGVLDAKNMMATVSQANILLLEHSDTLSAVDRINGFLDTISGNEKYTIVSRLESLGQTEIAMPVVEKAVEDGLQFDVIMALNDQSALGALAAIKEKGLAQKIYIYGVDGSPDMKNFIQNTQDIQATVAQSPVTIGTEAVQSVYQLLAGEKVENNITVPVELIDKTNISDFEIAGWQ